ncbi:unnamed protein product [Parajaminaea phylloscopi]
MDEWDRSEAEPAATNPRHDLVSSFLEHHDIRPQEFYALHGPTASKWEFQERERIVNLPFTSQQRDALRSSLYAQLLAATTSTSASSGGLVPRPATADFRYSLASETEAFHAVRAAGWSITNAQRSLHQARQQQAPTKATPLSNSPSSIRGPTNAGPSVGVDAGTSGVETAPQGPALTDLGPEYSEERKGMPCGHIFQKGEAIWRCRDCALDDTCVQCGPCFTASIHNREGHDVVFSVSSHSGGCCDCGDEEAWVKDVGCTYHCHPADAHLDDQDDASSQSRAADDEWKDGTPSDAVDRQVLRALRSQLAPDQQQQLQDVLQSWIDFILVVLDHAPSEQKLFPRSFAQSSIAEAISKVESMADLRGSGSYEPAPRHSGLDSDDDLSWERRILARAQGPEHFGSEEADFASLTGGDGTPATRWGSLPPEPATPGPSRARQYALILWNDEKHSFREVIDTVKEALTITEAQARNVADRVDKNGRDILAVSVDVRLLVTYARRMAGIDLEVTIRPAYDVLCEEVAHWLVDAIRDFSEATFYYDGDPANGAPLSNASTTRLLLTSTLLGQWQARLRHEDSFASPHMASDFFDPKRLSRLDGLLLMDQKLRKETRGWVRAWYMNLIARKEGRRAVSFSFASVYPKIVETFVLREREPEHSVMLITVQLFSVPSIASDLVRHCNFLLRLLMILKAIYTGQLVPATGTLHLPPRSTSNGLASSQSTLIRSVYCRHVFYDIRYLLQSQGVQEQIISDETHLLKFLDFIGLFHSILPAKRQTQHHVEYEGELWIAVFSVCQLLAKQIKIFGEAYTRASPSTILRALLLVSHKALLCALTLQPGDLEMSNQVLFHPVTFGGEEFEVINFAVDQQAVSFHHPVHWLFAEILKPLAAVPDAQGSGSDSGGSEVTPASLHLALDESGFLIVFEHSLRVVVKIAQVKIGMWVRNGAPTRGQATHYRDVTMRHIMYDQDLFVLQAGLALTPSPTRTLVNYIDRFGVLGYFSGRPYASEDSTYTAAVDEAQQRFFAEEFLLMLVTLLSERSVAQAWPIEAVIRRETIHFLVLSQGTYSALTRNIPEHMTTHPSFERILSQVSNFRPPDGTTDLGIFELKDECYSEVDPFFYHYSRNQRERADARLREREKRAGRSPEDLVVVPQQNLTVGTRGIFAQSLKRVLVSQTMKTILFNAILVNCESDVQGVDGGGKEHGEAVVDAAMQLIMIGIIESGALFVEQTLSTACVSAHEAGGSRSIVQLLCDAEDKLKSRPLRAKAAWCLDSCSSDASLMPTATLLVRRYRRVTPPVEKAASSRKGGNASAQHSIDARRAAAKARQQAIMKKFNAQQKSLLQTLESESAGISSDTKEVGDGHSHMDVDQKVGDAVDGDGSNDVSEADLGVCILCQEELRRDRPFGSLALITQSRAIRTTPRGNLSSLREILDLPLTMDREMQGAVHSRQTAPADPWSDRTPDSHLSTSSGHGTSSEGFPRKDHKSGLHATTCGHLMHVACFDTYRRSVEQRHAAQIARNHAEDLTKNEFVCPLCKSLGNVLLPVPLPQQRAAGKVRSDAPNADEDDLAAGFGHQELDMSPIGDWLRRINIDILKTSGFGGGGAVQESTTGTGCFTSWFTDGNLLPLCDPAAGVELPEGVDESTIVMLDRLLQVLKPLAVATRPQRVAWQTRTILAPISRKMYIPEELVAYTLSVLEVSQRGMVPKDEGASKMSNVASGLSATTVSLLRSLIFCLRSIAVADQSNGIAKPLKAGGLASRRTALRQGVLKRLLPHWSSDESVRFPLLLRDPLAILVESVAITPENFVQITTLMYYAALTQTIFGLAQPSVWPQATSTAATSGAGGSVGATAPPNVSRGLAHLPPSPSLSAQDLEALEECFPDVKWTVGNIVGFVGYARGNVTLGIDGLDSVSLAKLLCSYTLPFLRRAAILRRVICGDESAVDYEGSSSEPVEYLRLLRYLQVTPPAQALPVRAERQAPISSIVEGWIKHAYAPLASLFRPLPISPTPPSAANDERDSTGSITGLGALGGPALGHSGFTQAHHPTLQLEHPHIYELASLPRDLTALLQHSQGTRCRRCNEVPPDPALCLFCGELVCYQTFCCMDRETERGECNRHVLECGGNVGIFFKIKANVVFCLYNSNGSFTFSPYLDSHGEVDIGLQKGRPQRLHQRRYDELRKTWLQGGIATLVARKLEGSMNVGGWITA